MVLESEGLPGPVGQACGSEGLSIRRFTYRSQGARYRRFVDPKVPVPKVWGSECFVDPKVWGSKLRVAFATLSDLSHSLVPTLLSQCRIVVDAIGFIHCSRPEALCREWHSTDTTCMYELTHSHQAERVCSQGLRHDGQCRTSDILQRISRAVDMHLRFNYTVERGQHRSISAMFARDCKDIALSSGC